jgi:hypothetical protein
VGDDGPATATRVPQLQRPLPAAEPQRPVQPSLPPVEPFRRQPEFVLISGSPHDSEMSFTSVEVNEIILSDECGEVRDVGIQLEQAIAQDSESGASAAARVRYSRSADAMCKDHSWLCSARLRVCFALLCFALQPRADHPQRHCVRVRTKRRRTKQRQTNAQ